MPDSPLSPWEPAPAPRLFSPLLVALSIVLAALVGLGAGLVLVRANAADSGSASDLPSVLITPAPSPSVGPVSPPPLEFPAPQTSVFTLAPPSPSPTPEPEPPPVATPTLRVDPAEGADGGTVVVVGTGWEPLVEVSLEYLDATGTPTAAAAVATADPTGGFTAQLAAQDPTGTPGDHVVRGTAGDVVAEGVYRALP